MGNPCLQYHDISVNFFDSAADIYHSEKPFYSNVPFTKNPDACSSNVQSVSRNIKIADVRGSEDVFNLDLHGFQLINNSTRFKSWKDGKRVVAQYYPEVEALLKKELHADEVVIYDHTVSIRVAK